VKAVAVVTNVPLSEPAGMESEVGTVRLGELEFRPTVPPPAPSRVTVQVLVALGARLPGLQAMEVIPSLTLTLTTPPVPVTGISSPAGVEARLFATSIERLLLPAGVSDKVATTPSEIGFEFEPQAMQV
jgi:hypothetical protein